MRLLLIEDEEPLGAVIRQGLEADGYQVEWARDGAAGLDLALTGEHDLLILDLMLPGRDGWSICGTLRDRRRQVPILMLTARDTVDDRVRGLDLGADDYLTKPFAFKELRARVRALLRRERVHRTRLLHIADLEIDLAEHTVRRSGEPISLTPREYALLEALATNEGRILSKELITARVWPDSEAFSNTVEVYVSALRRKIDADREPKLIQTVHRQGYVLRRPREPE